MYLSIIIITFSKTRSNENLIFTNLFASHYSTKKTTINYYEKAI